MVGWLMERTLVTGSRSGSQEEEALSSNTSWDLGMILVVKVSNVDWKGPCHHQLPIKKDVDRWLSIVGQDSLWWCGEEGNKTLVINRDGKKKTKSKSQKGLKELSRWEENRIFN